MPSDSHHRLAELQRHPYPTAETKFGFDCLSSRKMPEQTKQNYQQVLIFAQTGWEITAFHLRSNVHD
jgi:hypothetical protein